MSRIGRRLKLERTRQDLPQKQVAEAADVTPWQLSKIETGKIDPRWSVVERIAEALGVEVSELASREESPTKK